MLKTSGKTIAQRRAEINKTANHGIRAVCFDLDGVLVDAAEWHKDALNEALIAFDIDAISEEDHIKTYNGLSTYRKLDMLGVNPLGQRLIYEKKQDLTIDIIEERCTPVARIIETVERANLIFDNQVAVVTNCSRNTAKLMLKKSGLLHLFKFLVCNEDVDGKIKPHPRPYLLAQERFGLNGPKCLLAIDDTGRGIISAVDARCRTWFLKYFEELTADNLVGVLDSYRITI